MPRLVSLLLAVFVTSPLFAQGPAMGLDSDHWEHVTLTPPAGLSAVCAVEADGVTAVTGKPVSYIATTATWRNYRLEVEWRWPGPPGNGGILLHIASGPKDRAWPLCFQVQLKHGAVGDLLPMAGAEFAEALSTPPGAPTAILNHVGPDSEKPAGEWNTATITCRDGTIEVSVNGVDQNRVTGCSLSAGRIGFQLEGTPFEVRGLTITPVP